GALRHGHGVERQLQSDAAIDLLAEVFVPGGLAAFVVDDAVAAGAGVDAVDPPFDLNPFDRRLALILELRWTEAGGAEIGEVAGQEIAEDPARRRALDLAHGAIERRHLALEIVVRLVDQRVDPGGERRLE